MEASGLPQPQFLPLMAPPSQIQRTLLGYILIRRFSVYSTLLLPRSLWVKYWVYVILMRLGALLKSNSRTGQRLVNCNSMMNSNWCNAALSPLLSFPAPSNVFVINRLRSVVPLTTHIKFTGIYEHWGQTTRSFPPPWCHNFCYPPLPRLFRKLWVMRFLKGQLRTHLLTLLIMCSILLNL